MFRRPEGHEVYDHDHLKGSPYKKQLSLHMSEEELEVELKNAGDRLVVVDFFTTWCMPCKTIAPKIEELSTKYVDVVFCKVDVDEVEELGYDITHLPTFYFYKNSKKMDKFVGAKETGVEDKIIEWQNASVQLQS